MTDGVLAAPEAYALIGDAQTGKTASLIQRARDLAASADATETSRPTVLVTTGKPASLPYLEASLADLPAVRVASVEQVALEIMDHADARQLFGREPRLLDPYEERFLQEDVKVSQLSNKRLRKVEYFLFHGWSNLADDDPDWIQTEEEKLLIGIVRDIARFTGGIMPCELSNFAINTLRQSESARAAYRYDHVLVDDFELLSRASQRLLDALASQSTTITSNPIPGIPVAQGTDEPNFKGAAEFLELHPDAHVQPCSDSAQSTQILAVKSSLRRHTALTTPLCPAPASTTEGAYQVVPGNAMADELKTIAIACRQAEADGTSVLVVGTNAIWRKNVVSQLRKVGIDIGLDGKRTIRVKNFADEMDCDRAFQDTLAKLTADPADSVAWRSYLGFGDYVARSAQLCDMRKACSGTGIRLAEALDLLSRNELPGIDATDDFYAQIVQPYVKLRDELASGRAQIDPAAAARKPATFLVCSPSDALNHTADTVIFGGFVNGFIPCNAYFDSSQMVGTALDRERERCLRITHTVAGRACRRLIMTGFLSCSLEVAERFNLHSERVRLRDGIRQAVTSMSCILKDMQ